MQSQSEIFRKQGNDKYFQAKESSAPVSFQSYLNEAIILYNKALNLIKDPSEKASLFKNLAMSYNKMYSRESNPAKQLDNFNFSFKNFI